MPVAWRRNLIYRGRYLDAIALWSQFVDFPGGEESGEFSSLVKCPNPNHLTEKRHFQINLARPICHCFAGCGISGTYEKAIALIKGVSEREARKIILKSCQISDPSVSGRKRGRPRGNQSGADRVGTGNKVAAVSLDFSRYIPQAGLDYLFGRGIDGSSIASWGIGWAEDDRRIVIPARDRQGTDRFLIKRSVRDQDWPKYLYHPPGIAKSALLFGVLNWPTERDMLVLVEGSLDVIRLRQHGIPAVAILGTGISDKQVGIVEQINPKCVYLMFDKDASGVRNIEIAIKKIRKLPLRVCLYPKGKFDPAELSGAQAIRSVERSISLVKWNTKLKESRYGIALAKL
jgi:DNA primase